MVSGLPSELSHDGNLLQQINEPAEVLITCLTVPALVFTRDISDDTKGTWLNLALTNRFGHLCNLACPISISRVLFASSVTETQPIDFAMHDKINFLRFQLLPIGLGGSIYRGG